MLHDGPSGRTFDRRPVLSVIMVVPRGMFDRRRRGPAHDCCYAGTRASPSRRRTYVILRRTPETYIHTRTRRVLCSVSYRLASICHVREYLSRYAGCGRRYRANECTAVRRRVVPDLPVSQPPTTVN